MSKHECTKDILCLEKHSHMWYYGGWILERSDRTIVRIWKGKIQERPA